MGVLAIVVLVGFMVIIEKANADAFSRSDRARQLQLDNQELNVAMVNQQAAMRAYVNTARADRLEPYNSGRLRYEDARLRLAARATDPGTRDRLIEVEVAAMTWQQWAESRRISVQAAGAPVIDPDQADRGSRLFDLFRTADLAFEHWADGQAAAAIADVQAHRAAELTGLVGGGAVAVLALGGLLFRLARQVR